MCACAHGNLDLSSNYRGRPLAPGMMDTGGRLALCLQMREYVKRPKTCEANVSDSTQQTTQDRNPQGKGNAQGEPDRQPALSWGNRRSHGEGWSLCGARRSVLLSAGGREADAAQSRGVGTEALTGVPTSLSPKASPKAAASMCGMSFPPRKG